MKSLVESLFDRDLDTRSLIYDEILEPDMGGWELGDISDIDILDMSMRDSFKEREFKKTLNIKKWKDFTSRVGDKYILGPWARDMNGGRWQYEYFETIIMSCSSLKEIKNKLEEFIKEVKSPWRGNFKNDMYIESVEVIPLEGMGDMKGTPRLVTLKIHTTNPSYDTVIYFKLKKKA